MSQWHQICTDVFQTSGTFCPLSAKKLLWNKFNKNTARWAEAESKQRETMFEEEKEGVKQKLWSDRERNAETQSCNERPGLETHDPYVQENTMMWGGFQREI